MQRAAIWKRNVLKILDIWISQVLTGIHQNSALVARQAYPWRRRIVSSATFSVIGLLTRQDQYVIMT